MAESEGFEPPDGFPSTVFKTAAFDHSASSPLCAIVVTPLAAPITLPLKGEIALKWIFSPPSQAMAGNDTESLWALPGTCPRIATVTKAKTGLTHT